MSKLRTVAYGYMEESSVHGFQELRKLRSKPWKIFWILIMITVLSVCLHLLQELARDVLRDPRITSIIESDVFDEPTMFIYPVISPRHFKKMNLSAVNQDEIVKITVEYMNTMEFENNDSQRWVNGLNMSAESIKNEILEVVSNAHRKIQDSILNCELYRSTSLIWWDIPSPYNYIKKTMRKTQLVKHLSNNDSYIGKITQLLDLKHLVDLKNVSIPAFYMDRMKYVNMSKGFKVNVSHNQEKERRDFTLITSRIGVGYLVNLSVDHEPSKNDHTRSYELLKNSWNEITIYCNFLNARSVRWGIGSEYVYPDIEPQNVQNCETLRSVTEGSIIEIDITLQKRTYHQKYCRKLMKCSCPTDCLISKARKSEIKTCLPYLGVPHLRPDVDFCKCTDKYYVQGEKTWIQCNKECEKIPDWRPCTSLHVTEQSISKVNDTRQKKPRRGVIKLIVRVNLAQRLEHIHLDPKYTATSILSSVGGIIGIGFGMSIMSVMQIMFYCWKLLKVKTPVG